MKGIFGSETLYLEILQLPYDLECIPFGIYRTAYVTSSPPTHHLGKGLVHHDSSLSRAIRPVFIVMPIKAGKSSRMK